MFDLRTLWLKLALKINHHTYKMKIIREPTKKLTQSMTNSGYPECWRVGEWSSQFWKGLSLSLHNCKKW